MFSAHTLADPGPRRPHLRYIMVLCSLALIAAGCEKRDLGRDLGTPPSASTDASPIPAPPGMITFGIAYTDDKLAALDVREDGNILLAFIHSEQSATGYTYGLIDPEGHVLWSQFHWSYGWPVISLRAAAGNTGVLVMRSPLTSTSLLLALLDPAGSMTDSLDLSRKLTNATDAVRLDGGLVCIAGTPDNNQHGCILMHEPVHDSTRIWMSPVSDDMTETSSLVDVHDGTVLLTGRCSSKKDGIDHPFLFRFNPATLSYAPYDLSMLAGCYIRAITRMQTGVFALAIFDYRTHETIPHVRRMNLDGTVTWDRSWPEYTGFITTAIATLPDGGFIVGGYIGTRTRAGFLLRLDADGNPRWTRTIERALYDYMGRTPYPASSTEVSNVVVTHDGDIICGGNTNAYGSGGIDVWLMRLHPDGSVVTTFGR